MSSNLKATFFAVTAVLLWSTVATSFKIALRDLHYLQLLSIATYTSTFIFLIAILLKKNFYKSFYLTQKQWIISAISGFLNPYLYYIVLFKAYSILPAYMAQPLNYTWPVVLTLMSAWLLKQKMSLLSAIAFIFSLIGVFFISLSKNDIHQAVNIFGILLATGSSIIWSLYWIINVKDTRPVVQKMFLNFLFGSIYISLTMFFVELPDLRYGISFLAAIYVGFFEMGITFLFWLMALNYAQRTDKISIYIFLSPVISLIFISTVLKEEISFVAIVGFLFIAGGILISKWKEIFTFERERE